MIECNRIDLDEGIDANKTFNSKEYGLCHFCNLQIKISTIKNIIAMVVTICQ